jgi:hypothetical protein
MKKWFVESVEWDGKFETIYIYINKSTTTRKPTPALKLVPTMAM